MVCDCSTSVLCLRPCIYVEFKHTHKLELKNCHRKLRAANGLPIEVKDVACVPVKSRPKSNEHDFCVLDKPEADCLLGLDFSETKKCDPLFSRTQLRIASHYFATLYRKQFGYGHDNFLSCLVWDPLGYPWSHKNQPCPNIRVQTTPIQNLRPIRTQRQNSNKERNVCIKCIFNFT